MKSRKSATNDLIREETASGIDPADAVKYAVSKYAARGMNMTERKKFTCGEDTRRRDSGMKR